MGKEFLVLLLAQLVLVNCQYGQQPEISLDVTDQLSDPCQPNPCFNFGTCLSSEDFSGFWCFCPDNTLGDLCETLVTTTTPTTTTTTTRRALVQLPIRQQVGYGQPMRDLLPPTTTTTTPMPFRPVVQPQYNRQPVRLPPPTTTTTMAPVPVVPVQPSYGSFVPQLDLIPTTAAPVLPAWSNPCTEQVLRSPFIIQFPNPRDRASYIICVDVNSPVAMPCANGTFFNTRLAQCVSDSYVEPPCPQGFCLNDGECGLNTRGELACACRPGFSGARCEIDIDECALRGNAACTGGMCVDQINTYYCVCPSGVGLDCVNTIPEPCTSDSVDPDLAYYEIISPNNDHFLHCTNLGQWVVRKCADGLFWNQEEKTCSAERPILKTGACLLYPCKNGASCEDVGYNQYRCVCKTGYTGPHCETMIDYCLSNPCKNNGRCISYAGGYTCVCQDKVIDECCCNDIRNPCGTDSSVVYYPLSLPYRYIHCDNDGRAFVRSCPPRTVWVQSALSCLSQDIIIANATTPTPQIKLDLSDRKKLSPLPVLPVQQPSYGTMPDMQPTIARLPAKQPTGRVFQPVLQPAARVQAVQVVSQAQSERLAKLQQVQQARTFVPQTQTVQQPTAKVIPLLPVNTPVVEPTIPAEQTVNRGRFVATSRRL